MLSLQIDGFWEPEDFTEVLTGVESLYYKGALPWDRHSDWSFYRFYRDSSFGYFEDGQRFLNARLLARARTIASQPYRMHVERIQYASPGGIDLIGIGKACEAVADIIDRLVKHFSERELRRERDRQASIGTQRQQVELEKDRESLRSLKVSNARAILELRRDFPDLPEEELISLIADDQDRLIPRIAEGKLISASTSGLADKEGG